jgi:SsrA-binding protein
LAHKQELRKFRKEVEQQGLTIIPLSIYTNKTGIIKANIALCKGKKLYDKRASIKEKDIKRDLDRYGKE